MSDMIFVVRDGRELNRADWFAYLQEGGHSDKVGHTVIRSWIVMTDWVIGPPYAATFETMIFRIDRRSRYRGLPAGFQWRYKTEQAALKGHSDACRMVRSGWRGDNDNSSLKSLSRLLETLYPDRKRR